MGICQSQEEKTMAEKSKAIDREMVQGHTAQQNTIKLLLLGPFFSFILQNCHFDGSNANVF